jgi:acyl-CoA reductase-like NAD-dependent aldehyde dehydrogenase
LLIGGEWVDPVSGRWRAVDDPSTGEVIAEVPDGSAADADRAVAAARAAFDTGPWPRLSPGQRRECLLRLAEVLSGRAADLIELVTADAGCPVRITDMLQVGTPIGHLYDYAEYALLLQPGGSPIFHEPTFGHSEVVRSPIGVCAAFIPFNFPLFMAISKVGLAAAMGNTVVLKPSPLSPLAAGEFARACEEAGFPPGVVNVVHGDAEVGERLASHPGVNKVSFTGSTAVGRHVMALAAGTVKRVTLELGGKSPSVVLPDADLELAVRGTLFGSMIHAGQACVATTRMLVPASRYDEIVDLLSERAAAIVVGSAHDPASDVGPMISAGARDRALALVQSAVSDGAKVLVGGGRAEPVPGGHYLEPTVLLGVDNAMPVAREEIFGPVLSVIPYKTEAEALSIANDTIFGLAASVWGGDLERARSVAARIDAGTVWVNDFGIASPKTPFGGFKQSGLGREMSVEGALAHTELKHVYTALNGDVDSRPYSLVGFGWDE